ncbi:hypothetical protein [Cellulosimicrobium sp. NPDC055967]|uniref:hypothetical protein n=1 Tax=Cellulosimicrobium sp. NPDC055967 TaxID=3345670 RepID=UPI0035DD7883
MKRSLIGLAAGLAVVLGGVAVAAPASAASTSGYQICYGGKDVGATTTGKGTVQAKAPGGAVTTYYGATSTRSQVWAYGAGSTGTWSGSASTLISASGFCH